MGSTWQRPVVAIINYNGCSDTLECLSSLAQSTLTDFDLLVVDNASKDDSVKRIHEEYPDVGVLRLEKNIGYPGACNRAIQHAIGMEARQCLVLNNDTIVHPSALKLLTESSDHGKKVAAVGPKIMNYYNRQQILSLGGRINLRTGWSEHLGKGWEDDGAVVVPYEVHGFLDGCAIMFVLDKVASIGMMDESLFLYFDDSDWCYRTRAIGYTLLLNPKAMVWHKVGRSAGPRDPRVQYLSNRNRVTFEKRYATKADWLLFWVCTPWSRSQKAATGQNDRTHYARDYGSVPHVVKGLMDGLFGGNRFNSSYRFE